jgi:hypothetical protein
LSHSALLIYGVSNDSLSAPLADIDNLKAISIVSRNWPRLINNIAACFYSAVSRLKSIVQDAVRQAAVVTRHVIFYQVGIQSGLF